MLAIIFFFKCTSTKSKAMQWLPWVPVVQRCWLHTSTAQHWLHSRLLDTDRPMIDRDDTVVVVNDWRHAYKYPQTFFKKINKILEFD
jgi:hypothetical protein